jgi:putative ABC transport system permease protein
MDALFKDLSFALRQLRLNPLFTAVAVLSLALGIGANTAIFQLIDAIRLRSLAAANPQDLAYIDFAKGSKRGGWWSSRSSNFTSAQWESLRTHQQAFSGLVAWSAMNFNLAEGGKAHYAEGLFVNGDFFNVLGVPAAVGRTFTADDDRPDCGSPGAVISYTFWQNQFAADPSITTRTIRLDGRLFPIIGVAAPGFLASRSGISSKSRCQFAPTRCFGSPAEAIFRRGPLGGCR